MMPATSSSEKAQARAIIEALRAGIASTPASEVFASGQERIIRKFSTLLDKQSGALAVEGGYGQGKTHLLKHLAQLAHRRGYAVSLVPLSKEVPFNNWWHIYSAAVRHLTAPDSRGYGLEPLLRSHRWSDEPIQDLHRFAESRLHRRLPVLIEALFRTSDPEQQASLIDDLLGQPLTNAHIARAYRSATGERVKLPPARLRVTGRDYLALVSKLVRLSGYSGWVILFDEFELVCKLGLQSRAQAYLNLAHLLENERATGLDNTITVFTLINQMTSEFLIGGKNDLERIPSMLKGRVASELGHQAEEALNWLVRSKMSLVSPTAKETDAILDRIADLHEQAHEWRRPEGRFYAPALSIAERMRTRVRYCVESLDLARLYGVGNDLEAIEVVPDLPHEDEELFAGVPDVIDVDL